MTKEPICQLCSGVLAKEPDVKVQEGGGGTIAYLIAWVCKNCGTAWPVAVRSAGLFKGWQPLWEKNTRSE